MNANTETATNPETATTQEGGPSRVKKVSVALFERRRPTREEIEKSGGAYLGKIMGEATGFRSTERTDPKTSALVIDETLTGEFYVERPTKDGNMLVQSGSLFLPDGFHQSMLDHVAPTNEKGERANSGRFVRFIFEVWSIPRGDSAYSYEIRPIVETKSGEKKNILHLLQNAETAAREKIAAAKLLAAPKPGASEPEETESEQSAPAHAAKGKK